MSKITLDDIQKDFLKNLGERKDVDEYCDKFYMGRLLDKEYKENESKYNIKLEYQVKNAKNGKIYAHFGDIIFFTQNGLVRRTKNSNELILTNKGYEEYKKISLSKRNKPLL